MVQGRGEKAVSSRIGVRTRMVNSASFSFASLRLSRYNAGHRKSARENAMRTDTTSEPGRNRTTYLRFLQERAAVLLLAAFVVATAVGLWRVLSTGAELYR